MAVNPASKDDWCIVLVMNPFSDSSDRVANLLVQRGYPCVLRAQSPTQAWSLLDTTPGVGTILVDLSMSAEEGLRFCQALTQHPDLSDIPVLIMVGSGPSKEDLIRRALAVGVLDYVSTPVESIELLCRVGSALTFASERLYRKETKAVEDNAQKFSALCKQAEQALLLVNPYDGRILEVNEAMERQSGYLRTEIIGQPHHMLLAEALDAGFWKDHIEILERDGEVHYVEQHRRKNGETYPVDVQCKLVGYGEDNTVCFNVLREIRESPNPEQENELGESLQVVSQIMRHWPLGLIGLDESDHVILWAGQCSQLFDWTEQEVDGKAIDAIGLLSANDNATLRIALAELRDGTAAETDTWFKTQSQQGHDMYCRWHCSLVELGGRGITFCLIEDITERVQYESQLNDQTRHDSLTGLPNRMQFDFLLSAAIAEAQQKQQLLAVVSIGLNRFKKINDSLGHNTGDRVLKNVAERLNRCVRKRDCIARLGGDEFILLLPGIERRDGIVKVVQRVLQVFNKPMLRVNGEEVHLSVSIGVSFYPDDGEHSEQLVKHAEVARSHARKKGDNTYHFYTAGESVAEVESLILESSLRNALKRQEFRLFYQPKVDAQTEIITGMEALIRWEHPKLGMVSPGKFIPLAEETGLIIPMDEWSLRTACAQNKVWQEQGLPPVQVAVNLSGRQFHNEGLIELVDSVLKETRLDPAYLELEITESISMHTVTEGIATLRRLNGLGVSIAIDDFGTGHSSLSYVQRFPVNTLKIDQSFIRDLSLDPDDAAIVLATIEMAHALKLKVVAEGIETEEQLNFLKVHNCSLLQGYLFSRPVPTQEFERLLVEQQEFMAQHDTFSVL